MHIATKTIQLSRLFNSIYFWKIRKVEFALKCLHFFVVVKTRKNARKNKKTIIHCLFGKNYIAKNEHTSFYETFFRYKNLM